MMEYKGFKIQKQGWTFHYGEQSSEHIHYVVYREMDGEKYFISHEGKTAFDTEDEAKQVIDILTEN